MEHFICSYPIEMDGASPNGLMDLTKTCLMIDAQLPVTRCFLSQFVNLVIIEKKKSVVRA